MCLLLKNLIRKFYHKTLLFVHLKAIITLQKRVQNIRKKLINEIIILKQAKFHK